MSHSANKPHKANDQVLLPRCSGPKLVKITILYHQAAFMKAPDLQADGMRDSFNATTLVPLSLYLIALSALSNELSI